MSCIIRVFELIKKGQQYSHDSYYFDSYQQADQFIEEVKSIDCEYFSGENRELYAPKHDIITQTYGMKKSVHLIYPVFTLKQSELNRSQILDGRIVPALKQMMTNSAKAEIELGRLNWAMEHPLIGEHRLIFRRLDKVQTAAYFVLYYKILYQKYSNWNPFQYRINEYFIDDEIHNTTIAPDSILHPLSEIQISCQLSRSRDVQTQTEPYWLSRYSDPTSVVELPVAPVSPLSADDPWEGYPDGLR